MPLTLPRAFLRGLAAAAFVAASQASAADLALVIANYDYQRLDDPRAAENLRPIARQLAREGFDVIETYNARTGDMAEAAAQFQRRASDADRVIILLDGHFVSTGTDAWLLSTDTRDVDQLTVASQGLSLSALAEIAGRNAAGRAVIFAGRSSELRLRGEGLRIGTQGVDLPQGVTLASGNSNRLEAAILQGLLNRDKSLNEALSQLAARGFLTDSLGFTDGGRSGPVVDVDAVTQAALDEGFWNAARAIDTEAALQLYIERYPRGRFRTQANNRITALVADRQGRWEREETNLNLSRDDRRKLQRDLTLLGYNTRGIDGIFGQGTRSAIGRWQRDRGHEVTSFLTDRQWRQISDEGDRRRAQQAQQDERAETTFWRQNGADGGEAGLRRYLERYPRGRFAEDARRELQEIEAARETEDRRAERRAWQQAQEINSVAGYRDFLNSYGNSEFANQAQARIRALQAAAEDNDNDRLRAARDEEREILNSPVTRLLVEQRLQSLGYDPGFVDGNFKDDTRDAIKRYQKDRGIDITGYVTKRTAGFLLAGR
ncbi:MULTISPECIES: peptidoglycan-binding domain-containing protein [unclassified Marinovum]